MANFVDQKPNVYFTEWPTFIWKIVGFNIHQKNPIDCDYLGMRFRLHLELSFGRYYNEDTYNLRIVTNHLQIPDEFEEFEVSTCIVDKFGQIHFAAVSQVTRSVLVKREPIWTANRMDLFLKYDCLKVVSGEKEILTLKCAFGPKYTAENAGIVEDEAVCRGSCSKVAADFLKLYRESLTPDSTLKCENKSYPVHRLILSTRCKLYFDDLRMPSTSDTFKIDMKSGILERILEFIYGGSLPRLDCDVACDLYNFGMEYMEDLAGVCRKYLVESLSQENAVRVLTIANEKEDSGFERDVTEFIINNPGVLLRDDWNNVKLQLACNVYYEFVVRYDSVFLS